MQFLILALAAALATAPAVLLIPRARQSPAFDRVLWGATWLLAFFGALAAPGYLTDSSLKRLVIAEVALMPALIGAAVGAASLNLALWVMDRFGQPAVEESNLEEEKDRGDDSTQP